MTQERADNIKVNGKTVETVDNFVFLGSVVPNSSDDVKRRIALASVAFGRLKEKIWNRKDISNCIKIRLYNAFIVPIATYAAETWTLKAEDSRKLTVFENNCLRTLAGKTLRDRIKMIDIRKKLGIKAQIVDVMKFGHID